jgi:hypothetical protein
MIDQASVWSAVGDLIEKGWKEVKFEQHQDPLEANMTRANEVFEKIVDLVIRKFEDGEERGNLFEKVKHLKQSSLLEMAQRIKKVQRNNQEHLLSEIRNFKMLILKGFLDSQGILDCFEAIMDKLLANQVGVCCQTKTSEIAELRKENALLKQTNEFLKEETDFFKNKNNFEAKRASLEELIQPQVMMSQLLKNLGSEEKSLSIDTISKQVSKQTGTQSQLEVSRIAKKQPSKKHLSIKKTELGRRESMNTVKTGSLPECKPNEYLVELSSLISENRDLKLAKEKLECELKNTQSKYQDLAEDKIHTVNMLHFDNSNMVESLKKQLEDIKEIHRAEKASIIKRSHEDTERANKAIREIEASLIHKGSVIAQECELRYNEMVGALRSSLETTTIELNQQKDKIKDILDQKRIDSVRYETKIQELKAEVRKAQSTIEILKRQVKDENFFGTRMETTLIEGCSSPGYQMKKILEEANASTKRNSEYLKSEHLLSTEMQSSSDFKGKKLNFNQIDIANSLLLNKRRQSAKIRFNSKKIVEGTEESLELNPSSPHPGVNVNPAQKHYLFNSGTKRVPLKINITDEDLMCSSTKMGLIPPSKGSRENLLHSDITKYFSEASKLHTSQKKLNVFHAESSPNTLTRVDISMEALHHPANLRKYDMSPSSVSKPLDYFLKKKQSLQSLL